MLVELLEELLRVAPHLVMKHIVGFRVQGSLLRVTTHQTCVGSWSADGDFCSSGLVI